MNRIPRDTARRLDRLAWRAHLFHRYAHHPLCEAYRGEVLRVGRMWICKGCAFVALGALAGIALGCLLPALTTEALTLLTIAVLAWLACVFTAPWVRGMGKTGTRLLPTLGAVFLGFQGIRCGGVGGWGLALVLCLGTVLVIWAYRRRGPWRGPCAACPEREGRPCAGFRRQFRRERAFGRLAGRLLAGQRMVADHKIPPLN